MLTVIKNSKRYHIYSAEAHHTIQVKLIHQMGVWEATTAKVIIAQYDKDRLEDFLKLVGMPGEEWPEIRTKKDLTDTLEEIRKQKCYTVVFCHFACMAVPIFKNGKVVASIGFYLPDIRLTEETKPLLESKLIEAAEKANKILG